MRTTRKGSALAKTSRCVCLLLSFAGLALALPTPRALAQDETRPPEAAQAPDPITPGTETELLMRDGRLITGMLVEQSQERIVLSISGIATPFARDAVERVRALPGVEERYRQLRDSIDDADVENLIRLSEWLRSRGRLDLALWEIDHVLALEPANQGARELRVLIVEQQRVIDARREAREAKERDAAAQAPAFPLLSQEQINLIRVFEVDLRSPPRLLVPRETVKKFLTKYAGRTVEGRGAVPSTPEGREMFYRQTPADLLGWMFDMRARELYPEVEVLENPRSMRMFRDDVNRTWLVNNCATNKCHGGEEAGRLWLFNKRPGSDAAAYTNFLILDRFKTEGGLGLIDYAEPARSPLLDLGLPRQQAVFKHPEVVGAGRGHWTPAFRGRTDDAYERAIEWIRSMYPQRTGYPIDYTPPTPRAARVEGVPPAPR